MPDMDIELTHLLCRNGDRMMDDLAEQSVDELMEVEGMDEEISASLFMKARESWFAER